MVAGYPLVVVPSEFTLLGMLADYFYGPRYLILAACSLLALVLLLKDRTRIEHPAFIPLTAFLFFALIAAALAAYPVIAWIGAPMRYTGLTTYFMCIILFVLAIASNKHGERLLGWMAASAAVVSLLALLQCAGLNLVPHEPFRKGLTAYGTLANPDFFGVYAAFTLPAAVMLYLKHGSKPWLLATALIYAGLLVSLNWGAWVAAWVGLGIVVLRARTIPEQKPALGRLGALLGVLTLFFILSLFPAPLWGGGEAAAVLSREAFADKLFTWSKAMHVFDCVWAFGIGPDHIGCLGLVSPSGLVIDKTHSIYLELAATMGVFALIAYLVFIGFFLRHRENGFFPLIAVYLVQGIFNMEVILTMPLFWIVLGLALSKKEAEACPAGA